MVVSKTRGAGYVLVHCVKVVAFFSFASLVNAIMSRQWLVILMGYKECVCISPLYRPCRPIVLYIYYIMECVLMVSVVNLVVYCGMLIVKGTCLLFNWLVLYN